MYVDYRRTKYKREKTLKFEGCTTCVHSVYKKSAGHFPETVVPGTDLKLILSQEIRRVKFAGKGILVIDVNKMLSQKILHTKP